MYGPDEMSSLHQLRLADARNIAAKLVVSSAMSDNPAIGPRTVSTPRRVGATLMQALPRHIPPELHAVADEEVCRVGVGVCEGGEGGLGASRALQSRLESQLGAALHELHNRRRCAPALQMYRKLDEAYRTVRDLLERNREALDR